MMNVHQFPCLTDNYGYLVHDPQSGETATVDTPDAQAILEAAQAKGWRITQIWNTHWHPDHAGGNAEIKQKTGAVVIGPQEVERIGQAPDVIVQHGDSVALGGLTARVLDVGGHTLGHVAFVIDAHKSAFVGDALFALGCGRIFEGTPEQMWTSLQSLAALPDDFTAYCAHEYTLSNARFATHVDPDNAALAARVKEIEALRAANKPTVPMSIGIEKQTNPFLRAPLFKARLGLEGQPDWAAFAEVRRQKDTFK